MAVEFERFVSTGVQMSWKPLFNPDVFIAMRNKVPFESVGCRFTVKGGALSEPVVTVVWVRNWAGEELSGSSHPICRLRMA